LCRRYGALWAYSDLGEGATVTGATSAYSRDSKSVGFHFCNSCGCLAYYLEIAPDEKGRRKVAVNMRMINDPEKLESVPVRRFEGFESFKDLPADQTKVKDLWF
jgi:hypothetical protein